MVPSESSDFDPQPPRGDASGESADPFEPGADDDSDYDSVASSSETEQVAELERRLAEQHEKYLRLAAEYENYRKRTMRERADAYARAQADLVRQFLDALDDLARFAHVDPATVDAGTLAQGVEMVEKKMLKSLTAAGLEVINPVNQSFDPKLHEAVATEPALSPEDDHVVSRAYQVGYLFNGQLLRPARVVVKQWNG